MKYIFELESAINFYDTKEKKYGIDFCIFQTLVY